MSDITTLMMAAAGNVGGDYQISRSLRFNSADDPHFNRTPASAGNRKTWTWSGWVKRSKLTAFQALFGVRASDVAQQVAFIRFTDGDALAVFSRDSSNVTEYSCTTNALFRDVSAWYHILFYLDTGNATESQRLGLYVNGVQQTFSSASYPTVDLLCSINTVDTHRIGSIASETRFDGYMADVHFIDGQALTPSSFGQIDSVTGVWSPKAYTGSYGTNGFYLEFADNSNVTASTLGKDTSGNGNNWTPAGSPGFSVTAGAGNDSLVDSPTRYGTDTGAGGTVRGNYSTMNPLDNYNTNAAVAFAFANGNLDVTRSSQSWASSRSTMAMNSGKWYAEMTVTASTAGTLNAMFGIAKQDFTINDYFGGQAGGYGYNAANGQKYNNGAGTAYGATFGLNDVIGVAYDADIGTLTFYKNGSSQGSAFTGLSGTFCFAIGLFPQTSGSITATLNCGQRPFAYTAPSGFKALVTTNLPDPTVVQGDDHFNTVLYTGTGSSLGVTGVGFQPDFVWIKERSGAADHGLYDAVRGVTKQIESNTQSDETTEATGLTAFGTDGFTVGALAQLNTSADTYVAWNWKANGAGSSNTDGTITSTVSANTTAGISIVTYTGTGANATVGHGLGAVPRMIMVKARTGGPTNWICYHTSVGNTAAVFLNLTDASFASSTYWNDTSPTSSVFSVGTNSATNGGTLVAYCFAEVEGFSKFGSLTGSGSADGPFVFLNFRPAFVMLKRTDSTSNWTILDFKREGYNVDNDPLFPNLANAEGTTDLADLLSNGFKLRSTDASVNASGGTYVYAAFSSNPFKYSLGR